MTLEVRGPRSPASDPRAGISRTTAPVLSARPLRLASEVLSEIRRTIDRRDDASQLKRQAAELFAKLNGWNLSHDSFTPHELAGRQTRQSDRFHVFSRHEILDHALYFRAGRRKAAIVGQPYGPDAQALAKALAARLGLIASMPPQPKASFHLPQACWIIVLHHPDHVVRWLPGQM